jgi:hypothetical protein
VSLKLFKWTICGRLDVAGALTGFADAARRMGWLESCHFRFVRFIHDSDAVEHEGFFENETQLLETILATKQSSCRFLVTTNSNEIFQSRSMFPTFNSFSLPLAYRCDWKLILFPFIRFHGLPIEFRYSSIKEKGV